ncbi:MAG: HAD family hydrolase [Oscillospiraceae bacterium]|nr:HAD family hydrolase [Oscillospiraceae bacterium]
MNKGIIFDLDGTLWDSSKEVLHAWNEVLESRVGRTYTLEDMHSYMGKTLEEIAAMMLPEYDENQRMEIMAECGKNEYAYLKKHGGVLFDGLEDMLKRLSEKYKLFIVSNCQSGYIELFLEYYGLGGYFADTECPGETGLGKGENIRIIIERNKLDRAVYIGDTQGDCNASDFAGIPFIHAAYGFGKINREVPSVNGIGGIEAAVKPYLDE